eukprot:TRINITY_DN815_c0_g2_i1.p1 TRINITY_DN815_c0_g2~~TRINITY_DN815_c0_g2_i1.p1  ORF type:complete len:446 (+),score=163.81 TRINITY_DN815_c0_g2_i1:85-1422(+)
MILNNFQLKTLIFIFLILFDFYFCKISILQAPETPPRFPSQFIVTIDTQDSSNYDFYYDGSGYRTRWDLTTSQGLKTFIFYCTKYGELFEYVQTDTGCTYTATPTADYYACGDLFFERIKEDKVIAATVDGINPLATLTAPEIQCPTNSDSICAEYEYTSSCNDHEYWFTQDIITEDNRDMWIPDHFQINGGTCSDSWTGSLSYFNFTLGSPDASLIEDYAESISPECKYIGSYSYYVDTLSSSPTPSISRSKSVSSSFSPTESPIYTSISPTFSPTSNPSSSTSSSLSNSPTSMPSVSPTNSITPSTSLRTRSRTPSLTPSPRASVSPSASQPPTDVCAYHRTCSDCSEDRDCVWCGSQENLDEGTCMSGTFFGPNRDYDSQCPKWQWGQCQITGQWFVVAVFFTGLFGLFCCIALGIFFVIMFKDRRKKRKARRSVRLLNETN